MVSWLDCAPQETATISVALPASFSRMASSTAISQNGFMAILTLAVSTPVPSALTRTLTLASMTRFDRDQYLHGRTRPAVLPGLLAASATKRLARPDAARPPHFAGAQ